LFADALLPARATGVRIGELTDLELDRVHEVLVGAWLKVPLGKLVAVSAFRGPDVTELFGPGSGSRCHSRGARRPDSHLGSEPDSVSDALGPGSR
jgi:hypothetical protein